MATKFLKSVKGRRMRITRLDGNGAKITGTCGSFVTDGFIQVTLSNELETGEEYTQKNAWGDFCVNEKDGDVIKWVNATIQMCGVHPDALDIMAGANPLLSSTNTVGVSFSPSPNTDAFALEVWTRNTTTGIASPTEWGYFVVPFIKNGQVDGDVTIAQQVLNMTVKGSGYIAPASWGVNPYADNPLLATGGMPTGDLWAVVSTTVQPPAATAGCVTLS